MNLWSTWLLMSGPPPMHSLMDTWVPLYGSVFVSQSSHFCCHTLFLECVHASVHEFMSTLHPMSGPPPMDSYTESWVPLCVTLSMSIHPGCGPTPCLEYFHASVHEFMSTWLLMCGPPPMYSLMETWGAPVWQCVCVPIIFFLFPHLV